jgi:hypothetical protein
VNDGRRRRRRTETEKGETESKDRKTTGPKVKGQKPKQAAVAAEEEKLPFHSQA